MRGNCGEDVNARVRASLRSRQHSAGAWMRVSGDTGEAGNVR
jgi:hypothetical protein